MISGDWSSDVCSSDLFFCESSGVLQDISGEGVVVSGLPLPPAGTAIQRVEVIVRVRTDAR